MAQLSPDKAIGNVVAVLLRVSRAIDAHLFGVLENASSVQGFSRGTQATRGPHTKNHPAKHKTQNETVKSPLCIYQTHCGHRATLGPPTPGAGFINRSLTCDTCGASGVSSENTE